MLTWKDLGGLGNLIICGKSRLLGETHLHVNFLTITVFGFVFILARIRISRKLHYRRGVIEYNV